MQRLTKADIRSAGFRRQRDLADFIGWSEEHLSRVMRGQKETPLILHRLIDALRLPSPKDPDHAQPE